MMRRMRRLLDWERTLKESMTVDKKPWEHRAAEFDGMQEWSADDIFNRIGYTAFD